MISLLATLSIVSLLSAPVADEGRALAAEVARLLTPPGRYQGMLEQLYRPLLANAEKAKEDREKLEQAAAQIRAAAAKAMPYDDLLAWTAEVYAAHFDTAELRALVKFYRSPAGAKLSSLLPQLNAELLQKVIAVFPRRFEDALKEKP